MIPVSQIPQEARRQLLLTLWRRGVKPRDLGVSRDYYYKMRKGVKPIPDHIMERILEIATDDDLARVPLLARYVDYESIKRVDAERMIRIFLEWAKANPASAKAAWETIGAELERLGLTGKIVVVTREHIEEWKAYLEARVREGTLSLETARDRDRYLRLVLEALGWKLGPRLVRHYIRKIALESPDKAAHIVKALRLFVKHVLGDREIYDSIPSVKPRHAEPKGPSWEEICKVINAVDYPPAKAYLYVLSSTGLRPETVWNLEVGQVRLEERLVWGGTGAPRGTTLGSSPCGPPSTSGSTSSGDAST